MLKQAKKKRRRKNNERRLQQSEKLPRHAKIKYLSKTHLYHDQLRTLLLGQVLDPVVRKLCKLLPWDFPEKGKAL